MCSGSLQILIDRVKARLEHQRSLKNDQKNDTRCENQSSIEKNEPQNVVTTPMNMADANIQAETASTSRSKRTIKPNPRVEFLLKRKRGMSVDSRSGKKLIYSNSLRNYEIFYLTKKFSFSLQLKITEQKRQNWSVIAK